MDIKIDISKNLIIGSTAIKHYYPDFKREPKDLDIVVSEPQKSSRNVEYLENPIILKYQKSGYLEQNLLLTLKASHLMFDIKWEKHIFDTQFLISKGCKINRELFYELYEYWNWYHPKNKRSDLKMSASDFFDNALKPYQNIPHDTLHTFLNPVPTYTKILVGEVEVCENKFNDLSFEDKCNLVYEEIEIMAIERMSNMDYRHAYTKMFKKFILSHAPLWEVIFIIENYKLLHKPRHNYFKIIEDGIKNYKSNL